MSLQPGGSRTPVCPGITALFLYITNHPKSNGFKQHHFVLVSVILKGLHKKKESKEEREDIGREKGRKGQKEKEGREEGKEGRGKMNERGRERGGE